MIRKVWQAIASIWRIKDVRRRLIFTLTFLVVLRFLAHIPLPGVNLSILKRVFAGSQLLGLLNIFSGGTLANFSITASGLNPYINASVVFQLLSFVFPYFENLSKEGEAGRQKIEFYTKLATIPLAIFQSLGMYALLKNQGIIVSLDPLSLAALVAALTTGTFILIWLGSLISEYGLGNGVSLLIFAGIVSQIPQGLAQSLVVVGHGGNFFNLLLWLGLSLVMIAAIVLVNEATRRVPVQYAKQIRGRRVYGGQATYLPLRLTQAGVIPIIFAVSLVMVPSMLGQFLSQVNNATVSRLANFLATAFAQGTLVYNLAYFFLVIIFTFFYTMVIFNPEKIAEEFQKRGGFIPGIRPGRATAEYLNYLSLRLTLPGAVFLGIVAILPSLMQKLTGTRALVLGGTSILIVVSVVLETVKMVEAMVQMRGYDKFLEKY